MRDRIQRFDPRQNMQRPKFEIFHYMDPKPGTVEVHHHEFYEIYFFLGGQVQYRVEGKVYSLRSGDLLLINPMELHRPLVESGGAYERFVLWIDKAYLAQCSQAGTDLLHCFDSSLPNYKTAVEVSAKDRDGLTLDIAMALSAAKVKVTALSARSLPDGHAAINIVAEVKNKDELNFVINKLNNIQGVYYVARASGK